MPTLESTKTIAPVALGMGAWLKNTSCLLAADGQWCDSVLHGDLSDPRACAALEHTVAAWLRVAGVRLVAHDLHPDFFSTQWAEQVAHTHALVRHAVQHHHAHIAAVVAEHALTEPVLGLALDGVGLGTDGKAWGGELLWLHGPRWQRLGHVQPLALPGGDKAAREPWRLLASAAHACGLDPLHVVPDRCGVRVPSSAVATIAQMLARRLHSPPSSSLGRWFDAAAAALGLLTHQTDEAQAAIALERLAESGLNASFSPCEGVVPRRGEGLPPADHERALALHRGEFHADGRQALADLVPHVLPLDAVWRSLLSVDVNDAPALARAAAQFHLDIADALAAWTVAEARALGVSAVCLGGGCFFNRILSARLTHTLHAAGLRVYRPTTRSVGDAGLALGQAWVAQQRALDVPPPNLPFHRGRSKQDFQETTSCV